MLQHYKQWSKNNGHFSVLKMGLFRLPLKNSESFLACKTIYQKYWMRKFCNFFWSWSCWAWYPTTNNNTNNARHSNKLFTNLLNLKMWKYLTENHGIHFNIFAIKIRTGFLGYPNLHTYLWQKGWVHLKGGRRGGGKAPTIPKGRLRNL